MKTPREWAVIHNRRHRIKYNARKFAKKHKKMIEANKGVKDMGLTLKAQQEFERVEDGTYLGICYMVVDIGTHTETYEGQSAEKHKIIIGWELPTALMSDGRPFVVSAFYTFSFFEAAKLRKMLESWRSRPFNEEELQGFHLSKIMGKPCMINVGKNKKGKTIVNTVMAPMQGLEVPKLFNQPVFFELDEFDPDVFNTLPNWIQEKINSSKERETLADKISRTAQDEWPDGVVETDEIPF